MTVKLLGPWGEQPSGTLYTTDATTEASMIAAKVATADLTGGVVYVPPGGATTAGGSGASGGSYLGAGNQAAMLAVTGSGVVVGAQFLRTDTSPAAPWYLTALPATVLSNWLPVGDTALTQRVPFNGAGTDVLHWIGPGRLMQVVQEASAVGSILIKDQMAAGLGPTVANLTTTGTPQTFLLNGGAGADVYGGVTLTIVGAGNSGYLVIGEV